MGAKDNEQEEDPREVRSEPPIPKKEWDADEQYLNTDNVYAESQPPNPLGRQGKNYVDADSQVFPEDFARILSRKGGDFLQMDNFDHTYRRKGKNKKRGRKNQYYTQIDAEDDQEVE